MLKYSFKQMKRAPIRNFSVFVIIIVTCALLNITVNLHFIIRDNTEAIKNEFNAIAVPSFFAWADDTGNVVTSSNATVGLVELAASDYDLSTLASLSGVQEIITHKQFGTYIDCDNKLERGAFGTEDISDVIIFQYVGEQPITIAPCLSSADAPRANVILEWSAVNTDIVTNDVQSLRFYMLPDEQLVNQTWTIAMEEDEIDEMWEEDEVGKKTGAFTMYPGERYIASVQLSYAVSIFENEIVDMRVDVITLDVDQSHSKPRLRYFKDTIREGWYIVQETSGYDTYPFIMRYNDEFWDSKAGDYYQDAIDVQQINVNTLTAIATSDLSMLLPFYHGGVYLTEGRPFEQDDYVCGTKVCIVSEYLANLNGWQIGDMVPMSFFKAIYGYNGNASEVTSIYEPLIGSSLSNDESFEKKDLFFDEGVYEIVGLYDGKVTKSHFASDSQYELSEGLDRTIILIPERSIENVPATSIGKYNTVIRLDNMLVNSFMTEAQNVDSEQLNNNGYQVDIKVYDQGVSNIVSKIEQLKNVSKWLMSTGIGAIFASLTVLATVIFYTNRKGIAVMRSLGARKRQVLTATLCGLLVLCLVGTVFGASIGYAVSDQVAAYILSTAPQDMADTSFSAMLARSNAETAELYAVTIQSRPIVSLFSGVTMFILISGLCNAIILREAKKSPILMLGAKE